jgi:hypothetical protein
MPEALDREEPIDMKRSGPARSSPTVVVTAALLASLAWTATSAADRRVDTQGLSVADFSKRVTAYVELTKRATQGLPHLTRTDVPSEITTREGELGNAIRVARASARPGDILTPGAARVFRQLIKDDFRHRPRRGQKVMRDEVPHFRPRVNQTYPSEWPLATFPATLLAKLPELPDGLEYRLLSEALILRDVNANIIVDFILDVF